MSDIRSKIFYDMDNSLLSAKVIFYINNKIWSNKRSIDYCILELTFVEGRIDYDESFNDTLLRNKDCDASDVDDALRILNHFIEKNIDRNDNEVEYIEWNSVSMFRVLDIAWLP